MNGEHKVGEGESPLPVNLGVVNLGVVEPRLIDDREFAKKLDVSLRAFDDLVASGIVSSGFQLGVRTRRWLYPMALLETVARLPRSERRAEPANLAEARRARIEALKNGAAHAATAGATQ